MRTAALAAKTIRVAAKPLTVRLDRTDYERLEEIADQLGMRPSTPARVLLHASLTGARTAVPAVLWTLDGPLAHNAPAGSPGRLLTETRQ